jgi:glycosyltransferase involved in cell wall biosynthesis
MNENFIEEENNIENEQYNTATEKKNKTFNVSVLSKTYKTRKVLMIAYYFPPIGLSGVQRTLKFVKYLPKYGWQPIVLTTGITNYYAFDNTLLDEIKDNAIIYRTEKDPFNIKNKQNNDVVEFPSAFKQKLGRLFLQSIFIPDSRSRWKKYALELGEKIIAEHPDIKLIYATAPPFTDFLVAKELSQKHSIPFIIDYRDLWTDNPQYFFPTPFHKRKHRNLEQNILMTASKSIVITRQMKEKIISKYRFVKHQDIAIIPHGFDKEDFGLQNIEKPNKLVITHSGIFPDDRTPKYFLDAVSKFLKSNPNAKNKIELRFIGLLTKQHKKLIHKYQLETNSVITGYLPHKESVKQIMSSDVLWLMLTNNIETPGKFFEYIGSKKPLLIMMHDGALKQISEEYKASFITEPKNINAITENIQNIYSLWEHNKLPKPTDEFIAQFDRKYLASLLAKEMSFADF